jgi:hypothetical protein
MHLFSEEGDRAGNENCRCLSRRLLPLNEHRQAPRRRLLKAGKISFGGGAIDCTVRNLSETGAALEVTTPVGIPERFTLVIEADQRHVQCHLVWRKERRIGVLFVRT